MRETGASGLVYRFGSFELNPLEGELRKHGVHIKLQDQPLQILSLLLEHPGHVVSREEIQTKLWPPDTHVDYDNAINSAMRKLREALSDTSENPRFIETLPRRGYRFLGTIERLPRTEPETESTPAAEAPVGSVERTKPGRRMPAIAVASAIPLIAAVVVFWLKWRPDANPGQLTPLPLTAAEGWESDPAFSPGGDQIVYAWDETGKGSSSHIYIKMVGSGRAVQLTAAPESDFSPTWSPDGRNIAFLRALKQTRAIFMIPPLGGSERKLTDGDFAGSVSWSPDGRFLAAAEIKPPEHHSSLYLIAAENGEKTRLTTLPDGKSWDEGPRFSPNGSTLLFKRCSGPFHCGLYLLDLTSDYRPKERPRILRQESGAIGGAAWTVDGKEVVYALSGDTHWNFHLMKVRAEAGGQPQRLTFSGERTDSPVIANRGNRLAYIQDVDDVDLWQVQPGKQPQPFASSTRGEDSPQYSPEGSRVAFSSNRSGLMQIWVCDADGRNSVQLTHFAVGHSGTPRWSPDGRWITFDRQIDEGWRIFIMASDGGQLRRLTRDSGADEVIPSWSGDGKWIYYSGNRTGRFQIWKAATLAGKGTQLTHNGGFVAFESRDGQSIYYTNDEKPNTNDEKPSLWMLPLVGGQARPVLDSVYGRSFAVMDDGIYYLTQPRADGGSSINLHRFATDKNEELVRFKERAFSMGLTVSPDRKTFLFTTWARSGSNVMVVDDFR